LASAKTVYADGDVIYREGRSCEHAIDVLSGTIDLLREKDGKFIRQGQLKTGDRFGKPGLPYDVTLRANGRTVVRIAGPSGALGRTVQEGGHAKPGIVESLLRRLGGDEPVSGPLADPSSQTYSSPGMIRRLLDGLSSDSDRISVRVALLSGEQGRQHTRHVIAALGNSRSIQTRGFDQQIMLDASGDLIGQLNRISTAARKWLLHQGADILVWGHVPAAAQVMHLRFITLTNWDPQAPGAFDLQTTLSLPVNFGAQFADLLRAVTLAAALPRTDEKRQVRQVALLEALGTGSAALEMIPPGMTRPERATVHCCFANALSTASRPGYDARLLARASERYRAALAILSQEEAPLDWAQAQKHLGSILHIEAERNGNESQLDEALDALHAASDVLVADHQPQAWATLQYRLGLIYHRQGFDQDDIKRLRQALGCFKNALKIYTVDTMPLRWAEIMSSFAQTAQVLGGHFHSLEALATAAHAYGAVLQVRNREKMPMAWAASQNNLGSALFLLGKQTRNTERLRAAITAFEQALQVYNNTNSRSLSDITEKNMERAKDLFDLYERQDMPQLVWEEVLFEDQSPAVDILSESVERPASKGDLPWPGEALESNRDAGPTDWFREAM